MIVKALRTPESAPKAAKAASEIGKSLAGNGSSQKAAAAGAAAAKVAGSSSGASATGAGNHAGATNKNN